MAAFTLRKTDPTDTAQIPALYAAAFPDEDLLPLVEALLEEEAGVLSLSAISGEALVGHVLFTHGTLEGALETVALLGPLAVNPEHQRHGIGKALIAEGLACLKDAGVAEVLVLGDPAYYSRSGFHPHARITPPYPLPEAYAEAWQWLRPDGDSEPLQGQLVLPGPWMQPGLWG